MSDGDYFAVTSHDDALVDELTQSPSLVVVSPHLDDAVLSCGLLMARRAASGLDTQVVTVFTSGPDTRPQAGSLGETLLAAWNLPWPDAYAERRVEDQIALSIIGVAGRHLGFTDAPFRQTTVTLDTLFSGWTESPGVPALTDALISQIARPVVEALDRADAVLLPAGCGGHLDHVACARLADRVHRRHNLVAHYLDVPYAVAADRPHCAVLSAREPEHLLVKVNAVSAYRSQLSSLWGSGIDAGTGLRRVASLTGTGHVERYIRVEEGKRP